MIIEDERILARNLKAFLVNRCSDVRVAHDGGQAIELLGSFAPDVAVIDYGLPNMNGLETYGEMLLRCDRRIGCVLITGFPLEPIALSASALGIRHLLCKPFSLAELQNMIEISTG
jgi:two-component system response regulator